MELSFLYVPVTELAAAEAFYREVLGLEEAWREGDGTVAFGLPGSPVQVMVSTDPHPAGPMYLVDDVAAWQAEHPTLPVRVARKEIPGGAVVGLADPAGNVFYVFDQES